MKKIINNVDVKTYGRLNGGDAKALLNKELPLYTINCLKYKYVLN